MRKSFFKILAVFMFSLCIIPIPKAGAAKTVRASVSSQVAEAYGREILVKYETMTGFNVQTYVGPSQVAISRLVNGVSSIAITAYRISHDMKENGYWVYSARFKRIQTAL